MEKPLVVADAKRKIDNVSRRTSKFMILGLCARKFVFVYLEVSFIQLGLI